MKYELAVFDLDGTLIDTLEDLTDSVNYALIESQYPERTLEEIRQFVGDGVRKLVERSVPEGTPGFMVDHVFKIFSEYYKAHCADKTKPYRGVTQLLERLRDEGVKTAVVSNKADYAVKNLCDQYFPGLLDATVGERIGIARKPAPDAVFEVLKELGVEKENAVYIGDSDIDVKTAANAGLTCIAVDWGFRDAECLRNAGATTIVSTPEEVFELQK